MSSPTNGFQHNISNKPTCMSFIYCVQIYLFLFLQLDIECTCGTRKGEFPKWEFEYGDEEQKRSRGKKKQNNLFSGRHQRPGWAALFVPQEKKIDSICQRARDKKRRERGKENSSEQKQKLIFSLLSAGCGPASRQSNSSLFVEEG